MDKFRAWCKKNYEVFYAVFIFLAVFFMGYCIVADFILRF